MCQPSASSAIELNHQPALISTTIVTSVMTTTSREPRSAARLSVTKIWSCAQCVATSRGLDADTVINSGLQADRNTDRSRFWHSPIICAAVESVRRLQQPVQLVFQLQTLFLLIFEVFIGAGLDTLLDANDLFIDMMVFVEQLGEVGIAHLQIVNEVFVLRKFVDQCVMFDGHCRLPSRIVGSS